MSNNENQVCSFCNQPGSCSTSFFQGPGMNTHICSECVTFAKKLLLAKPREEKQGECSFCGRTKSQPIQLLFGPGVTICNKCVAFASRRLGGNEPGEKALVFSWRRIFARVRSLAFGRHIEKATSARA